MLKRFLLLFVLFLWTRYRRVDETVAFLFIGTFYFLVNYLYWRQPWWPSYASEIPLHCAMFTWRKNFSLLAEISVSFSKSVLLDTICGFEKKFKIEKCFFAFYQVQSWGVIWLYAFELKVCFFRNFRNQVTVASFHVYLIKIMLSGSKENLRHCQPKFCV